MQAQVEEELFEGGEVDMGEVQYNWSDKYRPRKPRQELTRFYR